MDSFWCSPRLIIADNIVKYPVEYREPEADYFDRLPLKD
jgi:hypothetical protein